MKKSFIIAILAYCLVACSDSDGPLPNTAPTVFGPGAESFANTGTALSVSFNVQDDRDALSQLQLQVSSNNADLIPTANISTRIENNSVIVEFTPNALLGDAELSLSVTDSGGLSSSATVAVSIEARIVTVGTIVREILNSDPNSTPQNLGLLNIQENNDDFADLF